jgi:hypothetical protein
MHSGHLVDCGDDLVVGLPGGSGLLLPAQEWGACDAQRLHRVAGQRRADARYLLPRNGDAYPIPVPWAPSRVSVTVCMNVYVCVCMLPESLSVWVCKCVHAFL